MLCIGSRDGSEAPIDDPDGTCGAPTAPPLDPWEWRHGLGMVDNGLIGGGLEIRGLRESRSDAVDPERGIWAQRAPSLVVGDS